VLHAPAAVAAKFAVSVADGDVATEVAEESRGPAAASAHHYNTTITNASAMTTMPPPPAPF